MTFADSTSATPPTAPLAGAFSPDHSIFFVSTAGDDEIHFISIPANLSPTSPPTDTQQLSPALPACTPVSAGGNDAGCLYPTAPAAQRPWFRRRHHSQAALGFDHSSAGTATRASLAFKIDS